MRDEKRIMNGRTYHECFNIFEEVRTARANKEIRMRDYPAAIVSCADSWRNYMDYVTESSGKANALSYKKTPVLESALLTLGDIGTTNRLQELYWSLCRTPCGKNCDDDCKCS